jgi:F0F1-type ATP synthase membrane subunit b/b'
MKRHVVLVVVTLAFTTATLASLARANPPPVPPPGAAAPGTRPPGVVPQGPTPVPRPRPQHPPPQGLAPVPPPPPSSTPELAEHEEEGPLPVNWLDFSNAEQRPYAAALINFAILLAIYVYFGKKPIADALKTRRSEVAHQIEEAQKIKHEAEERSKQYAAKLVDLTTEVAETKAALAVAGVGEKARIVREAEEKAARMKRDAEFLLAQEEKQARQDLQREAVSLAIAQAEELLRSKITAADQERLAEEFLTTLSARPGKPQGALGGAS